MYNGQTKIAHISEFYIIINLSVCELNEFLSFLNIVCETLDNFMMNDVVNVIL